MTDSNETDNDDRTLEERINEEMVNDDEDPLEALFADDPPDEIEVGEDLTIDTAEFFDRLDALADAAAVVGSLADDVATLRRSGLEDADVTALIYGRKHDLTKKNIEATLDALDDIQSGGGADREEMLLMLTRDISHVNKGEVEQVFEELRDLRARYGGGDRSESEP